MYLTFKNNSENKMIVTVENQKHMINASDSIEVFCQGMNVVFETQICAFDELTDTVNELKSERESKSLKDRLLSKFAVKFAEKLPEAVLDLSVKYEVNCSGADNAVVNLYDGFYSVFDGKIADFFDMVPVCYVFSRAETETEGIRIIDVSAVNRKKYLKLVRKVLLFLRFGLYELIWFLPEYFSVCFCSSHFFIKKLISDLYDKTVEEREGILKEKESACEENEEKGGCLKSIVKASVVILILGGIIAWAMTSEPETVVSEDLNSVVCYDEKFVRIDGGLPSDAEKVFLQDYSAWYPLADGSYDSDTYYCFIYETSDGARYMWLKDNCTSDEAADMGYEDYDNPLIYKSVGKIKD